MEDNSREAEHGIALDLVDRVGDRVAIMAGSEVDSDQDQDWQVVKADVVVVVAIVEPAVSAIVETGKHTRLPEDLVVVSVVDHCSASTWVAGIETVDSCVAAVAGNLVGAAILDAGLVEEHSKVFGESEVGPERRPVGGRAQEGEDEN